MLKIVKVSIAIASVALFSIGHANAHVGEIFVDNCTIVKSDDKGELSKKAKYVKPDFKLKLKDFSTNSPCVENHLSLSRVASKDRINARF
ncbi:hypothetical protein [Paraglaciecola sp. 2405UD69-4]|uniref:hypothetical protein n=1 Tax=Paraglaciecola sp. 2405UD69-4 TaxID=3391836 RepID=UPI0039C948CE